MAESNMKIRFFWITSLFFLLAACATSPLGRRQFIWLPDSVVDSLGSSSFAQMKTEVTNNKSPEEQKFVDCVVDALLKANQIPGKWEVVVFKRSEANAFASPPGKIGVFTGILPITNTQDKLAAVLGHEIGHVLARHANERLSTALPLQIALSVASGFVPGGVQGEKIMNLLGMGTKLGVILPNSRADETEADRLGLRLMARAGFDPREAAALWRAMAKAGGARPLEFLSTHPAPKTRIATLQKEIPLFIPVAEEARRSGFAPQCVPPPQKENKEKS